jgi:hypothetical protein
MSVVINDYKSEGNINMIINASQKLINDKYKELNISNGEIVDIVNKIIYSICSDAVLIKSVVKLMELNKITLSKVRDHCDNYNKVIENDITEQNDLTYNSDVLIKKVLELESKRNSLSSLTTANIQPKINKTENVQQDNNIHTNIDINLKIIEKLDSIIKDKNIKTKNFIINSYNRDWINNIQRNILRFSINIDLTKYYIKPTKILLSKDIKNISPYITLMITDNNITNKFTFAPKITNDNWDIWEMINDDNDNIVSLSAKNWNISLLDFLNKDLNVGKDAIKIIEVNELGDNLYNIEIDNSNIIFYNDFKLKLLNIDDIILIKTSNDDNINARIINIEKNIITIFAENIKKIDFVNAKLLNYKAQYSIIMTYYLKL